MLVHLISLENENPIEVYKTIRKELEQYDPELSLKKEIIVLTKTDIVDDPAYIKKVIEKMKKNAESIFTISLYDDKTVKIFQNALLEKIKEA